MYVWLIRREEAARSDFHVWNGWQYNPGEEPGVGAGRAWAPGPALPLMRHMTRELTTSFGLLALNQSKPPFPPL